VRQTSGRIAAKSILSTFAALADHRKSSGETARLGAANARVA
jgi:hypothetical protein